jgi:hypothetical protein
MMLTATGSEERLDRIHQAGYWRILMHPTAFDPGRIPTLAKAWATATCASVTLRAWDYPHIAVDEQVRGDDWVQSGAAIDGYAEVWRFFQSGQFVHQFSMEEDLGGFRPESLPRLVVPPPPSARTLHVRNALYTLTEIFQFARNLAYRGVLDPFARVLIELHGTGGRRLALPGEPWQPGLFRADLDVIRWERTLSGAELVAAAPRLAREAALYIVERFGWDAPADLLERDQHRLLERRL